MNYLIAILSILVVVLFLFVKNLYDDNKQLKENNNLIISGYETSIKNLEDKAKFDLDIEKSKAPTIKASQKVKIENQKRGTIESNISDDFVITSF